MARRPTPALAAVWLSLLALAGPLTAAVAPPTEWRSTAGEVESRVLDEPLLNSARSVRDDLHLPGIQPTPHANVGQTGHGHGLAPLGTAMAHDGEHDLRNGLGAPLLC